MYKSQWYQAVQEHTVAYYIKINIIDHFTVSSLSAKLDKHVSKYGEAICSNVRLLLKFEHFVFQIDNKGNHLLVSEEASINVPAIAAAHVTKRYTAQATDELTFEVTYEKYC